MNGKTQGEHDLNKIFQNEIQIHASLDHRYIVRLFDYEEREGNFFLILELCSQNL